MTRDDNFARYHDPSVVAFYERKGEIFECEKHLFGQYVAPGCKVLDIGVGGGRTTPFLAQIAGKYVGVDYSDAMVAVCRKKFPELEFFTADATDMPMVADAMYDAVVFSFNGIDTIRSDESRARCFREINRVLERGGVFILSSHNAKVLAIWPQLRKARGHQIPWRIVRAVVLSFPLARRTLMSGAYSAGEGYVRDPVHGGMDHYSSTPATMEPQLHAAGFEVIEVVGGHYPDDLPLALTPWHYYACRKVSTPDDAH